MKYLGKKSLSSYLGVFMQIMQYVVIIGSIFLVIIMSIILFAEPVEDPAATGIAKANYLFFQELKNDKDALMIKDLPLAVKALFLPYLAAVIILMLTILKKCRKLFYNFTNDVVFKQGNVMLIKEISKLVIISSIMTFNFYSLLVGLILLVICDIFKNGTALQEEHDLTV